MVNFLILLALLLSSYTHSLEVRIPSTGQTDSRNAYKVELLKLILSKSPVQHALSFTTTTYSQARIIETLKTPNKDINLYWMGTSKQLENELRPIRIPLYRGLSGYRVLIINQHRQADFRKVNSLAQLQTLTGAQGIGWSDTIILENAGLKQYLTTYENIFNMINHNRNLDYFSRSIIEARNEISTRIERLPNLAIEEHLLLIYPFAMFFFTNQADKQLAEVIEQGFKRAYSDGSFLKFFNNHPEINAILASQEFKNRKRIIIDNPTLSAATKAIDKRYWLNNSMLTPAQAN